VKNSNSLNEALDSVALADPVAQAVLDSADPEALVADAVNAVVIDLVDALNAQKFSSIHQQSM
jgi:hypothetical protein